ncbi:2OG-Fe(II) oxygenase [Fimbriiglobus ruber]|uniref:Thiol peroxidase, Bcp-type n=1 Tax=Fimbriiglobus ruber TaxID=1908690 RepID=A0A225D418_9BACT|nr:2OG-Fe(II) oxygenase [Fimbriiglobus ruber]OWK35693.1 Thiol peroxidase, Bcp-type [Fimbriiglobus ruber]
MLSLGEPAPWFTARCTVNPTYQFDTVAGRYVILCFFGSAGDPAGGRVLAEIDRIGGGFDIENFCFFGVSTDPDDERLGRIVPRWPGVMFFWDFDRAISRLYGAAPPDGGPYRQHTVVLDQALRTLTVIPFEGDPAAHVPALVQFLKTLPPMRSLDGPAPVLVVPHVFDRPFCRALIDLYERHGGQESGYMKEMGGKTVQAMNYNYKRRSDHVIEDQGVIQAAEAQLQRRLIPEIRKAFQFNATHIERYIVACYDAADGGFFRRHRDHTTMATAHRRFAVTINLNAEEYEGGDLFFAEFGQRGYRAPTGGAVVFSCALTHEVRKMTRGKRYAFLPFLYDEEGEKVRQANLQYLDLSKVHVQT